MRWRRFLLEAKDRHVRESALTGESLSVGDAELLERRRRLGPPAVVEWLG